jgi:hypothetical protein
MRLALFLTVLFVACSSSNSTNLSGDAKDVVSDAGDETHDVPLGEDVTSLSDTRADDGASIEERAGDANLSGDGEISQDSDVCLACPDVQLPDVDFQSLPRMPAGKTFTTRYAASAVKKKITPDHPMYMGGFGFCGGAPDKCRISEGVHDDLYANIVLICDTEQEECIGFAGVDSVGLVHFDCDYIHLLAQKYVYEELGIYFEGGRLFVSSSHSHGAPDTTGLWGPMFGAGRDEQYIAFLREQVAQGAVEAFKTLEDVVLTYGVGSSPNSTDGSEPVIKDEEIWVIKGERPQGGTIFTLTRWNSHPTAYGSKNNGLTADYVGAFRKFMEEEYGGVSVFLNGNLGGTYPDRPTSCGLQEEAFPNGYHDPDLTPVDHMRTTCTGYQLFQNTKKALSATKPIQETGVEFWHGKFGFHPDNGTLLLAAKLAPVPFEWVDIDDPLSEMKTEFSAARIGNLFFISTPGESFPAFSKPVVDMLKEAGYEEVIVLGITQDWLGYLLTEEQWKDPMLSYNQGLSPGAKIHQAYIDAVKHFILGQQ